LEKPLKINMTSKNIVQKWKDLEYNRIIIAEFFKGNVQWGIEGSNKFIIEPRKKFDFRTSKNNWELICANVNQ